MTVFDKILSKEIPCEAVFENEKVLGFKDIYPQAKTHLVFIHKEKTKNLNDMMESSPTHALDLLKAIHQYTQETGLDMEGFRVVTNIGEAGGQTVFYTHFHLLSDTKLGSFGK